MSTTTYIDTTYNTFNATTANISIVFGNGTAPGSSMPATILTSLLSLLIVLGNGLIIVSVAIVKKLRQPANYLIVSLALSDFLVGMVVLPVTIYYDHVGEWNLGRAVCNLHLSFDVICCSASILNLCMISIDRYLMITKPMTYPKKRTGCLMTSLIAISWLLACIIVLPALFGTASADPRNNKVCLISQEVWFTVYSTTVAFYLPLAVMLCMYWKIFREASKFSTKEDRRTRSLQHNEVWTPPMSPYVQISRQSSECVNNTTYVIGMTDDVIAIRNDVASNESTVSLWNSDPSSGGVGGGGTTAITPPAGCDKLNVNLLTADHVISTCMCHGHHGNEKSTLSVMDSTLSSRRRSSGSVGLESVVDQQRFQYAKLPTRRHRHRYTIHRRNDVIKNHQQRNSRSDECFTVGGCLKSSMFRSARLHRSSKQKKRKNSCSGSPPSGGLIRYQQRKSSSRLSSLSVLNAGSGGAAAGRARRNAIDVKLEHGRKATVFDQIRRRVSFAASRERRRNVKATRTLGIIVGAFTICWLPFFTVTCIRASICIDPYSQDCLPAWLVRFVLWLGYMNSALNPFIYIGFSPDLRATFRHLIYCQCANVDRKLARRDFRLAVSEELRNTSRSLYGANESIL